MGSVVSTTIPGVSPIYRAWSDGTITGRGGNVVRGTKLKTGYHQHTLHGPNGMVCHRTHQWIMRAFAGPPISGWQVNHKNGNRADNRLENLEYVTHTENQRHSRRVLGRKNLQGEKHHAAKVSDLVVASIIVAPGLHREIAARFGVSRQFVSDVKSGKRRAG